MNGPRTNQFVAPTSFITSISRFREKIESRIVLAIRSAEEIRSTIVASRKAVESTFATVRTRSETTPPSLIFSIPAGSVGARRLRPTSFACSPSTGVTSNASGSGFPGRFSTISGCSFRIRSSASAFGTQPHVLDERIRVELHADGVDLLVGRLALARRVGAEVDLDEQLLLLVVAEGLRPGAEGDEEPEQEHADQHGHRRRDRGREVGAQRADRLGEEELEPHSLS